DSCNITSLEIDSLWRSSWKASSHSIGASDKPERRSCRSFEKLLPKKINCNNRPNMYMLENHGSIRSKIAHLFTGVVKNSAGLKRVKSLVNVVEEGNSYQQ